MRKRETGVFIICFISAFLWMSCSSKPKTAIQQRSNELRRSSPASQGVATEGILRFLEAVDKEQLELHSFMLLRHGRIITEAWWYPYRSDMNHIMHSVSKTLTSTAIGFAVNENLLTVDDAVISFFPQDLPADISPHLSALTVKHLLTMTVGNEQPPVFTKEEDNWVKSFLSTPIPNEPGSRFQYSSYATYILSAIIQKLTGESVLDYLKPRLLIPLGIDTMQWEVDNRGINTGGWGVRMKTIDMARLGQFYLQKGKWQGVQLLPESWIEEATTAHIYQKPDRTPEENANDDGAQGYGYQIWRSTHDAYRADGARGQLIVVLPEKDAVIVTTANEPNMHRIMKLMWEHLIPVMFDYNLDSDEMSNEMLISSISSLQLPPPYHTPDSLLPLKNVSYSFHMEPNQEGIQKVSFVFKEDGDILLTLYKEGKEYELPFGWDVWRYGETEKTGPYYLNKRRIPTGLSPFKVTGYGSWIHANQLNLRLLYLTESHYENYRCSFINNQVVIHLTNSEQSNARIIELKGIREE